MFAEFPQSDTDTSSITVAEVSDHRDATDCVAAIEEELHGLSKAMADRFEELALIHELTDRLSLEEDCRTLCRDLLEQLSPCVGARTIAIVLHGDKENGINHQLFQLGQTIDSKWISAIDAVCEDQPTVTIRNAWETPTNETCRLVVVRIKHQQRALGWMIAIRDPQQDEFGTIQGDLMKSTAMMLGMHLANQRQYLELQNMFEGMIESLVSALDAKDTYTCGHSNRVSDLAVELASRLEYDEAGVANIRMAGILHDIGKIGVDDSVLRKPGKLTEEEFEQIKQHPVLGYEILKGIRRFKSILPAVRHHHESWDGSGYPDGLKEDAIPRDAQIMAVADAFDAMTSDRPYRPGMSLEKVTAIFANGRGQQWAADVVDVLLSSPELMETRARRESGETQTY